MNIAQIRPEAVPHSIESEQQLIGMMLLNPSVAGSVQRAGGVDLFYDPVHAAIFEVIAAKERGNFSVGIIEVADVMRSHEGLNELGGKAYLVRTAGASLSAHAAPSYIDLLRDMRRKRQLSTAISEAQASITRGDEPSADIASRLEIALMELADAGDNSGPVPMQHAVALALEQINSAYMGDNFAQVTSGIPALDKIVSGFYPGELILIGGRPSMGKTGVALSIALNAARAGHGVVIASLEMNPESMAMRALSEATASTQAAGSYSDMRRGTLTEAQKDAMLSVARGVADLPITFLPRQFSDLGALYAGAKQAKRAMGDKMRLLIIDYTQLLRVPGKAGRYEVITEISIALKALAGQLNMPIIALSQLSRGIESREDKRPMMSDLKESGQLEQDADAILFCYRDAYYLEREKPVAADENNKTADELKLESAWTIAMDAAHNKLEIIVAKQRQGEIGTAHVRFNPALNLIWEA